MDDRTFGNPHHEVRSSPWKNRCIGITYLTSRRDGVSASVCDKAIGAASGVSYHTVDGSEIAKQPPGMYVQNHVHHGIIYLPYQLVSRISGASTVSRRYPVVCYQIQGSKVDAAKDRRVPNLEPTKGPMAAPMPKYLKQFHAQIWVEPIMCVLWTCEIDGWEPFNFLLQNAT